MTTEETRYTNDPKPKGSTMIFALPEAGGKLLLELMAIAGRTEVTGNQEPSFYHGITVIAESLSSNANDYGPVKDVAQGDNGLRFYGRDDKERDLHLTHYQLKNIILKGCSSCGIALTEHLRDDGKNWLGRYVQAIRDINDSSGHYHFRIAFLTCDLSEVKYANPAAHNAQLQEFKEASELGDIWIKKSELLADPMKVMLKLKCAFYPNEAKVNEIMKRYYETV